MVAMLDGPRLSPASGGKAEQLVVLLHGYGADGNDLIGLGAEWSPVLPGAAFVSPNAPEMVPQSPFGGRQWFSLQTYNDAALLEGCRAAFPGLAAFIAAEQHRLGLSPAQTAIAGFSQGTMMALYTAYRLPEPLAAVVGFSGHLAGASRFNAEVTAKPPALLIHGAEDEVVPAAALLPAQQALSSAGVQVQTMLRPGLGHGIDAEGLKAAGTFLRKAFSIE